MLLSFSAIAVEQVNTSLFSDKAIKGFDTVAYFTQGKAIAGNEEYSTKYKKATWLFSNKENLDLFIENPEKYAPQYGGYCAYAVSQNSTASIKPELFTIHEDKLYLNYSESINAKWRADKARYVVQANENWPNLVDD